LQKNEGSVHGTKEVHSPLHNQNKKRIMLLFSHVASSSFAQVAVMSDGVTRVNGEILSSKRKKSLVVGGGKEGEHGK